MRFTAGLVSMKYTKIELATDRVRRRPNQKDALLTSHSFSLSPPPRSHSVLLAVPLFSPSCPLAPCVPSAPVRGLYYKERTERGRQLALLFQSAGPLFGRQRKAIPN